MTMIALLDSVTTLHIVSPVSQVPLSTCSSNSSAPVMLNHQDDSLNTFVK